MTGEVVETRVIKGWGCDFTIQVIKGSDWIRLKETHSGPVSNQHCAEVVISLSKMNYTWEDRRGKTHAKGVFASHIPLFKAAEDKFIDLLGHHLKKEYEYEKFSQRDWGIIRWDLKGALSQQVPEKEMKEKIDRIDKESVLRPLRGAKMNAKLFGFPHIIPEIDRLIEEVALFEPIKEDK